MTITANLTLQEYCIKKTTRQDYLDLALLLFDNELVCFFPSVVNCYEMNTKQTLNCGIF